jgi:predicted phosphodiesterase
MAKITLHGEMAKEFLNRFPNTPILTLAKKLYKEQPLVFDSPENCRDMLRYHSGLKGSCQKNKLKDKSLVREKTYNYNPFDLPESHKKTINVWRLPKAYSKTLILSDLHFPFQDNDAIVGALKYGKEKGVDSIYINGDMLDFYQLSFHEKDPRKTSIKTELEMGREFFAMLRRDFPECAIYYIQGNHENRMERYLRVKAPELLDVEEFRLDVLLRMAEYGVVEVPYTSKCYFGKLLVEHGDKMRGSGGVNPARTLSLNFKRPTLCGHFHRTSSSNSVVYDDDNIMCWSTGCLCELEPSYMPLNNHNHGAAIVEVDHLTGRFKVENFIIINGRVY